MGFADLMKKFVKELDDYWHSRNHPTYKRIMTSMHKYTHPVDLLKNDDIIEIKEVKEFIEKFKNHTDDYKAYRAHYFIIRDLKIEYKTDKEAWDKLEYWQSPYITWVKNSGDCEDFTLLWLKLMQLLGVPSYKCMAIVDYKLGHCYPVYFTGFRTVNMDLTYYTNVFRISNRKTFSVPQGDYKEVTVAFNWRSCYARPYWMR
jgi:hypothetical protein